MDYNPPLLLSLSFLCLYFVKLLFSSIGKPSKLPPGPKPWPIIGNAHVFSDKPHRSLSALAKIHGPLMSLRVGSLTSIVVSSVDMAREVFQKHDLSFSSRPIQDAARATNHHNYSMIWLPLSDQWRNLRKICNAHLFTKQRLDATQPLRQKKVHELLEYVGECTRKGQAVGIGEAAFTTSLNLLSNTFFSIDLATYSSASSHEFNNLVRSAMEIIAKPNSADYFPVLGYFDPHGIRRDAETIANKFLAVFDEIISKRLSSDDLMEDDVLATLLKLSKEDGSNLDLDDIKHLMIDLFIAGTDTSSSTIEWAMTKLLCDPRKMEKAQSELDEILGKDGLVQESDIERLLYLQAIVKETLRLHPPAPFLIPHKAVNDVELCGYVVPRGSQLLVNVWAIGRDPDTWQDPGVFNPERFMGSKVDFRGQDFELIPFGAGRRICPGMTLAYKMMHLVLATLLYSYNWKLENGVREEDLDMNEKIGLTLQKAKALMAIPVAKFSAV